MLVVACNTISATCFDEIQSVSPIPVVSVITPTVQEVIRKTKTKAIGVIATRATIQSGIYEREIKILDNTIQIVQQPCPLFVPLAEEGFTNHPATRLIAHEYLGIFKKYTIDTLILGCTHYPLLFPVIQQVVSKKVQLVDSAQPTAHALQRVLKEKGLLSKTLYFPHHRFFVTDAPQRVFQVANEFFLGNLPGTLEKVTLND